MPIVNFVIFISFQFPQLPNWSTFFSNLFSYFLGEFNVYIVIGIAISSIASVLRTLIKNPPPSSILTTVKTGLTGIIVLSLISIVYGLCVFSLSIPPDNMPANHYNAPTFLPPFNYLQSWLELHEKEAITHLGYYLANQVLIDYHDTQLSKNKILNCYRSLFSNAEKIYIFAEEATMPRKKSNSGYEYKALFSYLIENEGFGTYRKGELGVTLYVARVDKLWKVTGIIPTNSDFFPWTNDKNCKKD